MIIPVCTTEKDNVTMEDERFKEYLLKIERGKIVNGF